MTDAWITFTEVLLFLGLAYAVTDLVLSVWLGRCVVPGLKCGECREAEKERRRR